MPSEKAAWIEIACDAKGVRQQQWQSWAEHLQASWAEEALATGKRRWLAWLADRPGMLEQALVLAAAMGIVPSRLQIRRLKAQDWQSAWQAHWRAKAIGKRLWLRPSFCQAPAPSGRVEIVLLPGMAFGTGEHATTQLCLMALEEALLAHPAASVLDFGTGSGVLAIAAAKLGARQVAGIDCAPEAVRAARANARRNRVRIALACGRCPPRRRFDVVLANVLAEPLIALAEALSWATRKRLILSGILREQWARVARAYQATGLCTQAVLYEGDWAALVLARD